MTSHFNYHQIYQPPCRTSRCHQILVINISSLRRNSLKWINSLIKTVSSRLLTTHLYLWAYSLSFDYQWGSGVFSEFERLWQDVIPDKSLSNPRNITWKSNLMWCDWPWCSQRYRPVRESWTWRPCTNQTTLNTATVDLRYTRLKITTCSG